MCAIVVAVWGVTWDIPELLDDEDDIDNWSDKSSIIHFIGFNHSVND